MQEKVVNYLLNKTSANIVPYDILEEYFSAKVLVLRCVLLQFFSATQTRIRVKYPPSILEMYLNTAPKFLHQSRRFYSGMRYSTALGTTRFLTCSSELTQHCAAQGCATPHILCPSTGQASSMLAASVIPFFNMYTPCVSYSI